MQKNTVCRGVVASLGSEGEGVVNLNGGRVFVPGCLSGEEVEFTLLKVKGDVAYGKLNNVLKTSPDRVPPLCPVFGKCGGCRLQHMSYPAQLEFKRGLVEGCLKKIGGLNVAVDPTVCGDQRYGPCPSAWTRAATTLSVCMLRARTALCPSTAAPCKGSGARPSSPP